MATWSQACKPCQNNRHDECKDTPRNPCDCKTNNHGKPKRIGKHRKPGEED